MTLKKDSLSVKTSRMSDILHDRRSENFDSLLDSSERNLGLDMMAKNEGSWDEFKGEWSRGNLDDKEIIKTEKLAKKFGQELF